MCRLFAQVSTKPESAQDLLVASEFSLLRQADADPAKPQKDGWGVAWFGADGRPNVTKSGGPAPSEREAFSRAAAAAVSTVVVGHLRAASNPHVNREYAHPFEDEGWVFVHNGTLTVSREVAAALGPRAARLKTDSDSEVYFQQFLKHLAASGGDPSRAFEACVDEDWRLWESCRSRYPDAATPYTSLNAIASNGRGIHALCHASGPGPAREAVFHPGQPWSVMSFATRGGRFVLSSEGEDGGDWTLLAPPETISAVPTGSRIDVRRRALSLGSPRGAVPEVSRS
ncbi:MAG TPA: class II glutamine amidotransferase [Elusimicrobiota bacterium]|jgi:predicted glutamine amidotransferase|nr:class II glutamine amidotransferase [Elusimicrobiota bacterium]